MRAVEVASETAARIELHYGDREPLRDLFPLGDDSARGIATCHGRGTLLAAKDREGIIGP